MEPAAYWILEQLGERDEEVEALNAFMHGMAGRKIGEDDLATFLRFAGFLQPGQDARQHPSWDRWLSHRGALSWQSEAADRSGRSITELGQITCSVLLVKGTVTAAWIKRVVNVLAARLPAARVIELEGDHACHIQSIDVFLEALVSLLEGGAVSAVNTKLPSAANGLGDP